MEAALCASEQLSPLFSLCDLLSFFFFPAGTEMLNSLPLKPMGIFPLNAATPAGSNSAADGADLLPLPVV